jgi:hypothetical protein
VLVQVMTKALMVNSFEPLHSILHNNYLQKWNAGTQENVEGLRRLEAQQLPVPEAWQWCQVGDEQALPQPQTATFLPSPPPLTSLICCTNNPLFALHCGTQRKENLALSCYFRYHCKHNSFPPYQWNKDGRMREGG